MDLPRTILVPTDFSMCSDKAVRYGLRLARQLNARVYLMHAWSMPYSRWDEVSERPQDVPPQLEAAARAKLDAHLQELSGDGPEVQTLFYAGDPGDCILRAAVEVRADMIVLGTHGRTGLSRVLEGSIAETVTRRAPCPVLAIRHLTEVPRPVDFGSSARP